MSQTQDLETEVYKLIDPGGYGWAAGDGPGVHEILEAVLKSDWLKAYCGAGATRMATLVGVHECRCDGGTYETMRRPFVPHPDCPIHGTAAEPNRD